MESRPSATVASENVDTVAATLSALSSVISDAALALMSWNVEQFKSAVERQRELAHSIASHPEWRSSIARGDSADALRKVRRANRVYKRLLEHSLSWTRTQQSILHYGGGPIHSHASIHFRG